MRRSPVQLGFLSLIAVAFTVSTVWSEMIIIDAFDRGHYRANGFNNASLENTFTGFVSVQQHSYFAFDLSSVPNAVFTNATLVLELSAYEGLSPALDFTVYDSSFSASSVVQNRPGGDPTGIQIFNDLGSGDVYGTGTVGFFPPFVPPPAPVMVSLSQFALDDLTAHSGVQFVLGVRVPSALGPSVAGVSFSADDVLDPGPWQHQLVLEYRLVPEPHSLTLVAMGLLVLCRRTRCVG